MSFLPKTEDERRQAISLTQAALSRLRKAVGNDCRFDAGDARVIALLDKFALSDHKDVFKFVQRNFRAHDIKLGLGVTDNNMQLMFAQLSRLVKALP